MTPQAAAPGTPAPEIPRGVSAADIATIWGLSLGSVYRLASLHQWRRYRERGRTYYHIRDVTETIDPLTG